MSENYENLSPNDQEELQKLEQNLAAMPDSAGAHYNLGLALAHRGEWDKAIDLFRSALKLKPGLLEARVNLSGVLLQKGQYRSEHRGSAQSPTV